jgi:hypothetical protein
MSEASRPSGSAYGTGAPSYQSTALQRAALEGRLKVAISIRDQRRAMGDAKRADRWAAICDELLDRLLEVRGL